MALQEKTLEELRTSQPRWTVAFDMSDEAHEAPVLVALPAGPG